MKHKRLVIGIIVGAIFGSITMYLLCKRFASAERYIMQEVVWSVDGERIKAIKMNTRTGETWGLTTSGWKLIHN